MEKVAFSNNNVLWIEGTIRKTATQISELEKIINSITKWKPYHLALAQDGNSTYNLLADEILIHGTY